MTNIVKLKMSGMDRLLRDTADHNFDEAVLFGFKDSDYYIISLGFESRTRTIGALEIIKNEILREK